MKTIVTTTMEFSQQGKFVAERILARDAVKPLIRALLIHKETNFRINLQLPEFVSQFQRHKQGSTALR